MQKSNDLSMKQALELMLKKFKLEKRAAEEDIMKAWIKLMGSFVAGNTTKIDFVKSKAIIYLKSSVMRNEFSMEKQKIIDMMNEELGANILVEIEFK